jgi:hypothetical protein
MTTTKTGKQPGVSLDFAHIVAVGGGYVKPVLFQMINPVSTATAGWRFIDMDIVNRIGSQQWAAEA